MTDQQRADTIYGNNRMAITPHIDKLASSGVICTNAYAQSPQCQPSRASILTGRHPTAHKVWWNETPLSRDEVTIGQHLRKLGYNTGYFGKLHITGDGSAIDIAHHFGFNHTYLLEEWANDINSPPAGFAELYKRVKRQFYLPMQHKAWTGHYTNQELHHDEVITTKAIDFIGRSARPTFTMVSYFGPHPPYACPNEYYSLYRDHEFHTPNRVVHDGHKLTKEDWIELKRNYYGAISWIDYNIGKLLGSIDNNTIVVFMSDHGDILGDHNKFSKGLYTYDGNTKIPLIFRSPSLKPTVHDKLVSAIDVFPTILELIGSHQPKSIQGVGLKKHLLRNTSSLGYTLSMIGCTERLKMIRNDRWKYWIYNDEEYLFDMVEDSGELTNLVKSKPAILSQMRLAMIKALVAAEDRLPAPHPV